MNRPSKILIVNPNTTPAVTERFVAAARRLAPTTQFDGVTGAFGAAVVSSEAENVIAGHAALEALASNWAGHDAAILAISFDSALEAARDLLPIPVIGVTEAMLLAASAIGPVGLVTFGTVSTPLYRRLLLRHGFADRVVGLETIEIDRVDAYLDASAADAAICAAAGSLVAGGAAAVVICGVAMVGAAERLQSRIAVPLFDSLAPAIAAAHAAIERGARTPRSRPPISTTSGLSPELAALIRGDGFDGSLLPASASTRKEPQ